MHVPMFLDEIETKKEKTAGVLTPMGDSADMWPQEISDAAYTQLPFLSDYDAFVVVDRVDEERGFGMGTVVVQNRTQMSAQELQEAEPRQVHIPWVIRDRQLAPLDVFVDGTNYDHLSEGRLRAAMFNPETFDAVRDRPAEPNLYSDLQPPLESSTGFSGGGTKIASATIIPKLSGQIHRPHLERLKTALADPVFYTGLANATDGVKAAFESMSRLAPSDPEKTAEIVHSKISPNVVQVIKLASGKYLLKSANSEMYNPQQEEVPPEVAEEMLADLDLTALMESDGTITASPDATVKRTLDSEEIKAVDGPGVWKVQDKMGQTLTGLAFPQLLSMDMEPMPLTLFTNGSEYALQEHVAGSFLAKTADLPRGRMQGYGALYFLDKGTPRALVPMTIQSVYRGADGEFHYSGVTDLQQQVDMIFVEGLKIIQKMGQDGDNLQYALPESMQGCWIPLKSKTELVDQPLMFTKVATAIPSALGEMISDGDVFTLRGPPFEKVAEKHRSFISWSDAEMLAVAAGVYPSDAREMVKEAARTKCSVIMRGVRPVVGMRSKIASARTKVKEAVEGLDLRRYDLMKDAVLISTSMGGKNKAASEMDDALTADKILGLGFLNAENVNTFVELIPGFEYAMSQIAEMLMASRLGLKDIPEIALERMMYALDDVIQGLRTLQQREISYGGN